MPKSFKSLPFKKTFLPILVIITVAFVAMAAVSLWYGGHTHPLPPYKAGEVLPDFALRTFEGKKRRLSELTAKSAKITVINFWATWCGSCLIEMPSLIRLSHQLKDQGLEVLAVNLDENPKKDVPPVATRLGMDFKIVLDPENHLTDYFDVEAIPVTVILGKNREILAVESGERDWDSKEWTDRFSLWLKN
jgi:thiol-disulfide isomerase/thioredoxin